LEQWRTSVGFLRRLVGGGEPDDRVDRPAAGADRAEGKDSAAGAEQRGSAEARGDAVDAAGDEEARYRALMRAEAIRLDDDLLQRQLRFADRAWVPPREGGERRADDADGRTDGE
jgi:hypothetical protein